MISSLGHQYQEIKHMQSYETKKKSLYRKGNFQLSKFQTTELEKIFSSSNRRLISTIHKELKPKTIKDEPLGQEKTAQ